MKQSVKAVLLKKGNGKITDSRFYIEVFDVSKEALYRENILML